MKHRGITLTTAALAVLLLAGCSSSTSEPEETATPTPTFATTAQVASVVAGYEQDWRKTIDAAGDCRFALTFEPAGLEATTCTFTEQTIGITALTAKADLAALEVPPELESLTSGTVSALEAIAGQDFAAACLVDGDYVESDNCNTVLGSRFASYGVLETQLDKWAPYL